MQVPQAGWPPPRIHRIPPRRQFLAGLLGVVLIVGSTVGSTYLIGRALLPSRVYWTEPDMARMTRDVASLDRVVPVLEQQYVVAYRNQDWCRNLSYSGGSYSTNFESATCNLFREPPAPFTDRANSDFAAIESALNDSGVWVRDVWAVEYDGGRLTHAEFDLVADWFEFNRWSYVYDPGGPLPEGRKNEQIYTRIDANWYFHWEDWM